MQSTGDVPHDWRRTGVFTVFGGSFVGAWQYVLFNIMLPRVSPMPANFFTLPIMKRFAHREGLKAVAVLTVLENAINQPFLHFPSLYFIKHKMEHFGTSTWSESMENAISTTKEKFIPDNVASLALWVPATIINGLFVPLHFRVPFITLCGCLWTSFLSLDKGVPATDSEPTPRVAIKVRKRTAEEIKSIDHGLDLIDNVDPTPQFKIRLRSLNDLDQSEPSKELATSTSKSSNQKSQIEICLGIPRK